ncbi:histidinol-phosphate transaminase [Micromonospora sp. NBRC 101691]|uniref:histidinol-phosphate transaminase n=1 Tax=Micromonospora sp. NBRC 101691 TaxID=3032198 RepID=UPI0024A23766|nr:histidinol-phosphate transaminase [Micromonospora sp. NBRC 101691]GLY22315.1 putative phenylalanine aminotransferase [Micromonospora sp. NBRC 101691]
MTVPSRASATAEPGYRPTLVEPGLVQLANNEVPDGPLPGAARALAEATTGVHRYPDPAAARLVDRLADQLGAAAGRVVVGDGSVSLCQQVLQALCGPGDEVVAGSPSFELYPVLSRAAGAVPRPVALTGGHVLDLDGMAAAVTPATRVVFLCNPNNPTGTTVDRDDLDRFLDRVPDRVLVVLDEAYRDFVDDRAVPDGVGLARSRGNVAVLRTFSKGYGLAGLRVGYGVFPVPVADAVRRLALPYAVNALAQIAALASLDAGDELRDRCRRIGRERDRVRAELVRAGFAVPPSQANFLWLPVGDRAEALAAHCRRHGVLVRAFPGLGVRVSVGTPAENDAFLRLVAAPEGPPDPPEAD